MPRFRLKTDSESPEEYEKAMAQEREKRSKKNKERKAEREKVAEELKKTQVLISMSDIGADKWAEAAKVAEACDQEISMPLIEALLDADFLAAARRGAERKVAAEKDLMNRLASMDKGGRRK